MRTVMKALLTLAIRSHKAFSLMTALLICALLLLIGLALLANGMSVLNNAQAESAKTNALAAANAGLDAALDTLDTSIIATQCPPGSVQGTAYSCGMLGSFMSGASQSITDPCTGSSMTIDRGLEVVWGRVGTTTGDARGSCVEAVVSPPSAGVQMPDNAVTAMRNIGGGGHMKISADPTDIGHPHDADVYANGNISSFTTLVDGNTYAAGSDGQPGYDGMTHSGAPPVQSPPGWQITSFSNYVASQAQRGTILTATSLAAAGSKYYPGDVYVEGNVTLTQGTVTFGGAHVYFSGNVTLSGQASIVNGGGGVIVVAGTFIEAGNAAGYQVGSNPRGVLAVMGAPTGGSLAGGSYAASISGNGDMNLGVVWTPFGSTRLAGNGNMTGMLVSGVDIAFSGGGSNGGFTFDHRLANLVIPMPARAHVLAYAEH